jgi:glycosyltransferase involved in cell wall biosynthesis
VVLASPDLRPSVLGVARSLLEAGLLRRFVTTVAAGGGGSWLARVLRSRVAPDWLRGRIQTYPAREVVRVAAQRLGLGPVTCDRVWEWAETGFDARVARDWAGTVPCLYGCEHASAESFRRQKARGGLTVLWQVMAHHRTAAALFRRELEQFPETVTPYTNHALRSAERVNGRKDEQYGLADLIVANSDFVRQTFLDAGIPPDKVITIPTGCPPVAAEDPAADGDQGPMVFLSAGTQSVRKGTHVLLAAWRRLAVRAVARLWLVGNMELPDRLLRNLPDSVVIRPAVPRAEMEGLFRQASVFVLPTLCEGRAHVVLEALAHGLPVVTTPNAGCGDVVRDGANGWLVPVADAEALAGRLAWCLEHPDEVCEMGRASRELVRRWQVSDFSARHAGVLAEFLRASGAA